MNEKEENIQANIEIHTQEARDFESLHPELFNATEYALLEDFESQLARVRDEQRPVKMLDLACGTGRLTQFFLAKGHSLTACDLSTHMLERLRRQLDGGAHDNLRIVASDVDIFLASDTTLYDALVMGAFLHHVPNINEFLARALTHVAPGGLCLIIHDPALRRKPLIPFGYVLEKIDSSLFQIKYWWQNRAFIPRSSSYSTADVHTSSGIDDFALVEWIKNHDFSIIRHARYFVHKTACITFLDRYVFRLLPQFVIIAQKKE